MSPLRMKSTLMPGTARSKVLGARIAALPREQEKHGAALSSSSRPGRREIAGESSLFAPHSCSWSGTATGERRNFCVEYQSGMR